MINLEDIYLSIIYYLTVLNTDLAESSIEFKADHSNVLKINTV